MGLVLKSLDAVSDDADGEVLEVNTPKSLYALQYTVANSFGGTWTIHFEASLDGENFFSKASAVLSGIGTFAIGANGPPVTHIRARLAKGSGTGTPAVSAVVAFQEG
jgi:hypothetical protein